jgi:hypothetical protein
VSAALLKLERFDAPALHAPNEHDLKVQQAPAEAYGEGYAAGLAASSQKTSEREKLMSALTSLAEAQALLAPGCVKEQAVATARVIVEAVFPALSKAGFAVEAATALLSIAKEGSGATMKIFASPEHAATLEDLIKEISPNAAISVAADPSIAGGAAIAEWAGGGVEFDLDRATADCLVALESAIGKISNGKSNEQR